VILRDGFRWNVAENHGGGVVESPIAERDQFNLAKAVPVELSRWWLLTLRSLYHS
jgi:hypothetical protein